MFWGTIHRMILAELLKVFFMALVALTGLILIAGIISEAMKNGFGPAQIAAIIPLLLPSLLPYTVPTTTLFATCIVYGRLSADNEILALKSAGVHILHVVWPALFLGIIASIVTMICYLDLIPYTGWQLRNSMIGEAEEVLYQMLRKDGNIKHPNISVEIYVKAMQGRKLQDVVFKRKAQGGGYDMIAVAKEAELRVDLAHKQILVDMRQCEILQGNGSGSGIVESKIWPVELPPEFFGGKAKFRAMDMTWSELFENQEKFQADFDKADLELRLLQAAQNLADQPGPNDAALIVNATNARTMAERMLYLIHAEFHMRPALSIGCLCFALVGCPVGIWFSKSDYLSAFMTCFLPIVVIYYPLMFCMFDLSRVGHIPPWTGIYNADSIMLITGAVLFRQLTRN